MKIAPVELHALTQLAHLAPTPNDIEALSREINTIMDFVEQLKSVDNIKGINMEEIAPLFHPLDMQQPLRADVVTEEDCFKELAEISPMFEDEHFLVPKVIEGK